MSEHYTGSHLTTYFGDMEVRPCRIHGSHSFVQWIQHCRRKVQIPAEASRLQQYPDILCSLRGQHILMEKTSS